MNRPRYYYPVPQLENPTPVSVDVCVYGGTSGGIMAAIQAARLGKSVALIAFGKRLGGLSAGGLGRTDVGNVGAFGGISREFYRRVGQEYGEPESWVFEPSVALRVFEAMLAETPVQVFREHRLDKVDKEGARITTLHCENGQSFHAKMFVDASYEGDLLAAAGVSYIVGRESGDTYGELYNGIQMGHGSHQWLRFVDPYVKPGDPQSGLLPGVEDLEPGINRAADKVVQAYNFRVTLTRADDRVPFYEPGGYDPERYTLLARYGPQGMRDSLRLTGWMPNGKTDTNNHGAFSSDNIGRNHAWPDGDYETRERIFQDHVTYNQGLYWFLSHDERVPREIRERVQEYGLPRDEYTDTGHWTPELYVREARRMVSEVVMTEQHCLLRYQIDDPIGLAAYQMDSHNCRRLVYGGRVVNEGDVQIKVREPYPISYRAVVPRKAEAENLIVPWALSASHIAFGSIRMEPVFMALGHACADACVQAMDANVALQDIDYGKLKEQLLKEDHRLSWPQPEDIAGQAPGDKIGFW